MGTTAQAKDMESADQMPAPEFWTRGREPPKCKGCRGNRDADDKGGPTPECPLSNTQRDDVDAAASHCFGSE